MGEDRSRTIPIDWVSDDFASITDENGEVILPVQLEAKVSHPSITARLVDANNAHVALVDGKIIANHPIAVRVWGLLDDDDDDAEAVYQLYFGGATSRFNGIFEQTLTITANDRFSAQVEPTATPTATPVPVAPRQVDTLCAGLSGTAETNCLLREVLEELKEANAPPLTQN